MSERTIGQLSQEAKADLIKDLQQRLSEMKEKEQSMRAFLAEAEAKLCFYEECVRQSQAALGQGRQWIEENSRLVSSLREQIGLLSMSLLSDALKSQNSLEEQ